MIVVWAYYLPSIWFLGVNAYFWPAVIRTYIQIYNIALKNRRAISLLLTANFTSGIAQGISMIAVPLYFAKTQQSNWFAAGYMFVTLVTLFWAPYAGALVDKYNRKKIFIVLMAFMGLALTSIALTSSIGGINNWVVFGAFALTFWNYSLHYICFYAFMQEITEKEH